MLARAPCDVTRANAAQVNVPLPRTLTHPAWGNGAVFPAMPGANARRTSQRARQKAQISQQRAARMRCAAGQLAERRTDCAGDSAHIWSSRSASMVDPSARTRSVRRASRSQISQRSRKDRPHHGVDVLRIEPRRWPHEELGGSKHHNPCEQTVAAGPCCGTPIRRSRRWPGRRSQNRTAHRSHGGPLVR